MLLRNGYYDGRNHQAASGSKRYYRANNPLSFWLLVSGGIFFATVLIGVGLFHLLRH